MQERVKPPTSFSQWYTSSFFCLSNSPGLHPHGLLVFGIALIDVRGPFPPALAWSLPHASLATRGCMGALDENITGTMIENENINQDSSLHVIYTCLSCSHEFGGSSHTLLLYVSLNCFKNTTASSKQKGFRVFPMAKISVNC